MRSPSLTAQRLTTVAAATLVALACGTNVCGRSVEPDFNDKLTIF